MADLERSLEILRAGAIRAQRRRQFVVLLAVVATGVLVTLAFQFFSIGTPAGVVERVAAPSVALS